jgi:hypothetical protein
MRWANGYTQAYAALQHKASLQEHRAKLEECRDPLDADPVMAPICLPVLLAAHSIPRYGAKR